MRLLLWKNCSLQSLLSSATTNFLTNFYFFSRIDRSLSVCCRSALVFGNDCTYSYFAYSGNLTKYVSPLHHIYFFVYGLHSSTYCRRYLLSTDCYEHVFLLQFTSYSVCTNQPPYNYGKSGWDNRISGTISHLDARVVCVLSWHSGTQYSEQGKNNLTNMSNQQFHLTGHIYN